MSGHRLGSGSEEMEDRVGRRWGINNFIGPLVYPVVPRFFFFDNGAFGLLAREDRSGYPRDPARLRERTW